VLTRAVVHGVLAATTTDTLDGPIRSYRDAFPTAFGR
jgi:hypothetical protein